MNWKLFQELFSKYAPKDTRFYPAFFIDLFLEIQFKKLGEFILLNDPKFENFKDRKVVIYANHFYYYDVHILNRLRKTLLKDRRILIWMEEFHTFPFFSKFAFILPFKTKEERIRSIAKTVKLLNQRPGDFYFFIFPEGTIHDDSDGIKQFNPKLKNFFEKIQPFVAVASIFLIKDKKIVVNFDEPRENIVEQKILEDLLRETRKIL